MGDNKISKICKILHLLIATNIFWACRSAENIKDSDCFGVYISNDTGYIADSCSSVIGDSFDKLCRAKYDSIKALALLNINSGAILVADYSYEEGIWSVIVWKGGMVQFLDPNWGPGRAVAMSTKMQIQLNNFIASHNSGEALSAIDSIVHKNNGSKIKYFSKTTNGFIINYSHDGSEEYQILMKALEYARAHSES